MVAEIITECEPLKFLYSGKTRLCYNYGVNRQFFDLSLIT